MTQNYSIKHVELQIRSKMDELGFEITGKLNNKPGDQRFFKKRWLTGIYVPKRCKKMHTHKDW